MLTLRMGYLAGLLLAASSGCGHQHPPPDDPVPGSSGGFQVTGTMKSEATYAMAVSPSADGGPLRVVAPISESGQFELTLEPGRPWLLVLFDPSKVGPQMVTGVFRADTLDTLLPLKTEGVLELGELILVEGRLQSVVALDALTSGLGLGAEGARIVGGLDDIALRYANPDIDGNGSVDFDEGRDRLMLDLDQQLRLRLVGRAAHVGDLVGQLPPDTAGLESLRTDISVSYPASFDGADPASGTVTFTQEAYYLPANSTTALLLPAGTPLGGTAISSRSTFDLRTFGVGLEAGGGHSLPQGLYRFAVGSKTLSFSGLVTPVDATLAAASDRLVPFFRFVPTVAGCTVGCNVSKVEYRWMRRTGAVWVSATAEDLAVQVRSEGAILTSVPTAENSGRLLTLSFPGDQVGGEVAWTTENVRLVGEQLDEAVLQALTTSQLCHLRLLVQDFFGLRPVVAFDNAPGSCS